MPRLSTRLFSLGLRGFGGFRVFRAEGLGCRELTQCSGSLRLESSDALMTCVCARSMYTCMYEYIYIYIYIYTYMEGERERERERASLHSIR